MFICIPFLFLSGLCCTLRGLKYDAFCVPIYTTWFYSFFFMFCCILFQIGIYNGVLLYSDHQSDPVSSSTSWGCSLVWIQCSCLSGTLPTNPIIHFLYPAHAQKEWGPTCCAACCIRSSLCLYAVPGLRTRTALGLVPPPTMPITLSLCGTRNAHAHST